MAKTIEGNLIAKGKKFCLIASRFNDFITKELVSGCIDALLRHGAEDKDLVVIWVPGAFEIPLTALKLAKKKSIDAVICLGAVIRGDTYHFDIVANEVSRGIMNVALTTEKPIIMGVLTTDTVNQAVKRAQDKGGENKGRDCAQAALEMIALLKQIK